MTPPILNPEVVIVGHDPVISPEASDERTARSATPETGQPQVARSPQESWTDLGNAKRFVNDHSAKIRYCHDWKTWLVWDRSRWRIDGDGEVHRLARQTINEMRRAAFTISDDDKRAGYLRHVRGTEQKARFEAMVSLATSEPEVAVMSNQLDADPFLLNCLNGAVDLRTGDLRKTKPSDLLTKQVPTRYDPQAKCPTFEKFLDTIMAGDQELIRYLQRIIGYSLTGDVSGKALFFFHGTGDNGKTTLLEAIRHVLGDYAGQIPIETLMMKRFDGGIPNDLARLKGLRFVTSSETEEGQSLAEAKIKQLTGGGTIQARFLYKEFFEFPPTHKIVMDANHKPNIRGTDNAIWNRVKLIPFNVSIPEAQQDKQLLSKLKAEAQGILAWAVRGCLEWQRIGLAEPDVVKHGVKEYRADMDVFGDFLAERCDLGDGFVATSKELYKEYTDWCEQSGEVPMTQRALGSQLGRRGPRPKKKNGARGWEGIRVRTPCSPTRPESGPGAFGSVKHMAAEVTATPQEPRVWRRA